MSRPSNKPFDRNHDNFMNDLAKTTLLESAMAMFRYTREERYQNKNPRVRHDPYRHVKFLFQSSDPPPSVTTNNRCGSYLFFVLFNVE